MAQVLIVDDSSSVRNEMCEYLSAQGISVITAVDGLEGLAQVSQHPELKLILTDINMPNLDGLSMTEQIRAAGNSVYIIISTTENSAELQQRGRQLGVTGWIVKPFNGASIIHAIQELLD